jgi:hypothetical protein
MKNIHILPTDKPSNLWLMHNKPQGLMLLKTASLLDGIPQHIYITSDEEIKRYGEYYLDIDTNEVKTSFENMGKYLSNEKKIIITDNKDLIKDGVQAIPNDFLEWFVKNPSCDEVEVGYGWIRLTETDNEGYWVSIPDKQFEMQQEEPKQIKCYCGHTITCDCEPLQETIEEFINQSNTPEGLDQFSYDKGLKDGAKWQKERMYSEEDMINFAHFYFKEEYNLAMMEINKTTKELLSEWFEQYKKK